MPNVTKTFSEVSVSDSFFLAKGERGTYELTGTFDATLILEYSKNGGKSWEPQLSTTATLTEAPLTKPGLYRFRCSVYTSGDPVITLADADDVLYRLTDKRTGQVPFEVRQSGVAMKRAVDVVTDAATVVLDMAHRDKAIFDWTLGDDRILGEPINPIDGALLVLRVRQGAGDSDFEIDFDAIFAWTDTIAETQPTVGLAKTTTYLFQYDETEDRWDAMGVRAEDAA